MTDIQKILAFTLAETLIVMGIIGVFVALTIPNLNGSTNDMEKVAKLKKVYAELNEAQDRAIAVYGPMDGWYGDIINTTACRTSNAYIGCKIRYFDRITEFMKVRTSCRDITDGNCMANENSKTLSDLDTNGWGTNYHFSSNYNKPQAVLANGASFLIGSLVEPKCNGGDIVSGALHNYCGDILVDIDGSNRGKSVYGIDLFGFVISKDGIIPTASGEFLSNPDNLHYCTSNGLYSTAWVLEKNNMDYLNENHDNSGTYTCKNNNNHLTWECGSCK